MAADNYRAGLSCQQKAFDLAPEVIQYRDYLSRNLFNYGRLLRDLDRPFDSAQLARRRGDLWPHDAQQLHSVAKELTLAVRQMPQGDRRRHEWVAASSAALDQAARAGWKPVHRSEIDAFSAVLGRQNVDANMLAADIDGSSR